MSAMNDPEAVRRQYATNEQLRVRQLTHEKYSVPQIDFVAWALNCVHWRGDERVLDVGSGAGLYYPYIVENMPNIQYHGLDFSGGILRHHPTPDPTNTLSLADAQTIPFAENTFDVVMANHMLYHVSDVEMALKEIKRVLKPGGVLMVATNSVQSMPELQVLMRRAIILLTRTGSAQVQAPMAASDLFALENGSRVLSHLFYGVVRYDLPSALIFDEIEPVMAYLETTRDLRESQLPPDVSWDDVMVIMRQQVTHLINHLGELTVNKLVGVLVASDDGDFIHEFNQYRLQTQQQA